MNMLRKSLFMLVSLFGLGIAIHAQNLTLNADDLILEQRYDGGLHLFIRMKPGMRSVLVTETTRDPGLQSDNYAYRAIDWNPVNGDEIRYIDGQPLPPGNRLYSLISSTPESHPVLGDAFHIFIPWVLTYGYYDSRHGDINVGDGTYLNLRAFGMPYGDYRGPFMDNPFVLQITQRPYEGPPGLFNQDAEEAFREIARNGNFIHAQGPEEMIDKLEAILEDEKGKSVDIVICFDTTESMKPYMDEVRSSLVPMLRDITAEYTEFRIGLVLFKDYYDEYLNRVIPFTTDFALFQRNLDAIRARGGGDIPEAVYEALYEGAIQFPWAAERRLMILVGDAPPHPRPRGRITKEMVDRAVEARNIEVSAILLPP